MKTRIAFALCLGVCSLSVLLPLGIFYIQDSVAVDLKKGEPFSVEFGTLSQMSEKSGAWQLNQVYRLNTANDNIGDFTLDKQTEKILNLEFYRYEVKQYSEQERKEFAWNMIQYLGLDSLKDWTYTALRTLNIGVFFYCFLSTLHRINSEQKILAEYTTVIQPDAKVAARR